MNNWCDIFILADLRLNRTDDLYYRTFSEASRYTLKIVCASPTLAECDGVSHGTICLVLVSIWIRNISIFPSMFSSESLSYQQNSYFYCNPKSVSMFTHSWTLVIAIDFCICLMKHSNYTKQLRLHTNKCFALLTKHTIQTELKIDFFHQFGCDWNVSAQWARCVKKFQRKIRITSWLF